MYLLRSRKEPIVGGFLDPMMVFVDEKLFMKAGCEASVSGIVKRRLQGIVGFNLGTHSVTIGGTGVYLVGGSLVMDFRRFSSRVLRGGSDVMASLMIDGSYPRASRRALKDAVMASMSVVSVQADEYLFNS